MADSRKPDLEIADLLFAARLAGKCGGCGKRAPEHTGKKEEELRRQKELEEQKRMKRFQRMSNM